MIDGPASDTCASVRTVLVHMDGTLAASQRLGIGCRVADRFGGDAFAMFCSEPSPASWQVAISESPAALFETLDWAAFHEARRVFDDMARDRPGSVWLDAGEGDPTQAFLRQARCADVVVLGTLAGAQGGAAVARPDFAADVLMHCGRPAIVVPAAAPPWRDDADVLVGWNGTPNAVRALAVAMPWLRQAAKVHVVMPEDEAVAGVDDGLGVHEALRRHGVEASIHRDHGGAADAGPRLERLAGELGCGLLVMGCYGHGRLRERVLGGATEHFLRSAALPVLMAH